jgi:hypothetical protein
MLTGPVDGDENDTLVPGHRGGDDRMIVGRRNLVFVTCAAGPAWGRRAGRKRDDHRKQQGFHGLFLPFPALAAAPCSDGFTSPGEPERVLFGGSVAPGTAG